LDQKDKASVADYSIWPGLQGEGL